MPLITSCNQHISYNSTRLSFAVLSFFAISVDVESWREELDFPATTWLSEYLLSVIQNIVQASKIFARLGVR